MHEHVSCRIPLFTFYFFFYFSAVILNNGWNEHAKANTANPSDHYQAMINIPKPNIMVGNQADG